MASGPSRERRDPSAQCAALATGPCACRAHRPMAGSRAGGSFSFQKEPDQDYMLWRLQVPSRTDGLWYPPCSVRLRSRLDSRASFCSVRSAAGAERRRLGLTTQPRFPAVLEAGHPSSGFLQGAACSPCPLVVEGEMALERCFSADTNPIAGPAS